MRLEQSPHLFSDLLFTFLGFWVQHRPDAQERMGVGRKHILGGLALFDDMAKDLQLAIDASHTAYSTKNKVLAGKEEKNHYGHYRYCYQRQKNSKILTCYSLIKMIFIPLRQGLMM